MSRDDAPKIWLLIDGNNWFCRDYFANPSSAITSFERRLEDAAKLLSPIRTAVAWDSPNTFRHRMRENYKAGRSIKPDGFAAKLDRLRKLLEELGVEQLQNADYESDDILASLANTAVDEGCAAVIASSDHDMHQMLRAGWINQALGFMRPKPGELRANWITAAKLKEQYGVEPWQWVDYRVLIGDKSDNLPGCPGIGPKTATLILSKCGTLEKFFEQPFKPAISGRQRAAVLQFQPQVAELRAMHCLRDDLIFEPSLA